MQEKAVVEISKLAGLPDTKIFRSLIKELAIKVAQEDKARFQAVSAVDERAIVPAWLLSEHMANILQTEIPFADINANGEIVGDGNISPYAKLLLVTDIIDAKSSIAVYNRAQVLRKNGHPVEYIACVLFAGNRDTKKFLLNTNIKVISLLVAQQLKQSVAQMPESESESESEIESNKKLFQIYFSGQYNPESYIA